MKNDDSGLARPTTTVDGDSIILTPLDDSSHEQLQELTKYVPLELDAHLWDVYEMQIMVHPRESDFQALDMIYVQWDLKGGSRHNL